ncbi:MAG TPA: ABC transporter permease, partial [Burkholderiaceae bacterium]|nr:ABC transporter permease [Burkholderiaceae bacterium]
MNLLLWLWRAQLRAQPARVVTAIAAIAIGVALGLAIHLINHSALAEFGRALAVVNGDAHLQVTGSGGPLAESWYPRIALDAGVADASPLIDIEVPVIEAARDGAPPRTIRLIGLDVFRAARVSPGLLPVPDDSAERGSQSPLFADDTVFVSAAAAARFGLATGDTLRLRSGLAVVELRVAGGVPGAAGGQALAVMDIGALQWRFGWSGRLSRIALRRADGIAPAAFADAAQRRDAGQLTFTLPDAARQRMSNLSRAYRVNLNVLSLVALFTGVFIVHASLALMVARQQPYLALIGVLGASRARLAALVAGQGLLLGLTGAAIGVAAGVLIASAALRTRGGDLGGGYFDDLHPVLTAEPATLAGYLLVGVAAGLVGSLWPALATRGLPLARALKGALPAVRRRRRIVVPLLLVLAGALLLRLPAWNELPVAAYAAIACWLFGGIAAVPWGLGALGALLGRASDLLWRRPALWLGSRRIAASGTGDAAALAGVVASFALATAMAVMVGSFRDSVDRWLGAVLPADLYLRAGSDGAGGGLDAGLQQRLRAVPGLARAEFMRTRSLTLDPARPPVVLIVRPLDPQDPARRLPVTGAVLPAPAGVPAVYVSEAMVDL